MIGIASVVWFCSMAMCLYLAPILRDSLNSQLFTVGIFMAIICLIAGIWTGVEAIVLLLKRGGYMK